MFRSIRFRLALWYTIAVALTFGLISWGIYEYVNRTLSATLDQSITNDVKWIIARVERQGLRIESDQTVRGDIFEHAAFYPLKEYIEIWDSTGTLIYHSSNLDFHDTLAQFTEIPSDRSCLLTTVTTFRNHDIRLAVQQTPNITVFLAMPTESVTTPGNELLRIFAWLGPVVLIIAAVGGAYLAKKSFSKINQVIEIAQRITADRLYDRIPEHPAKDEIGKIITTFNAMISRLDISFRQMKQFSADASHELRTPLTVMRTQLETALNSKITHTEVNRIIAHCLDETLRMSSLIENLLLLAQGDAGQDIFKRARVDVRQLIQETFEESAIIASQKSIRVSLDASVSAYVRGDEQRLRQMLLNLVVNAIKYNHERGTIDLSLTKENDMARISIADSGIGIPETEISRIFDRFYRVDRARSRELGGVGLGLSIVKWIVGAHGGTVRVSSAMNKGTEFTVLLPLESSGQ